MSDPLQPKTGQLEKWQHDRDLFDMTKAALTGLLVNEPRDDTGARLASDASVAKEVIKLAKATLTELEGEQEILEGEKQLANGDYITLDELKKELVQLEPLPTPDASAVNAQLLEAANEARIYIALDDSPMSIEQQGEQTEMVDTLRAAIDSATDKEAKG